VGATSLKGSADVLLLSKEEISPRVGRGRIPEEEKIKSQPFSINDSNSSVSAPADLVRNSREKSLAQLAEKVKALASMQQN